jgi:multisubunit Na+/H+ antiporter MnhG subunit
MGALAAVLLWAGVALLVVACLGSAVVRGMYERLHFVALAAAVGAPLVVVSLALRADAWAMTLKLLLICALLVGTGPATTAVTARGRSRASREEGR